MTLHGTAHSGSGFSRSEIERELHTFILLVLILYPYLWISLWKRTIRVLIGSLGRDDGHLSCESWCRRAVHVANSIYGGNTNISGALRSGTAFTLSMLNKHKHCPWYYDSPLVLRVLLPGGHFAANVMFTPAAVKQHHDTGVENLGGHGGDHSFVNPRRRAHSYFEIYT